MPHDPALVEDTRNWLGRASGDLRAAEHDLRATPSGARSWTRQWRRSSATSDGGQSYGRSHTSRVQTTGRSDESRHPPNQTADLVVTP